MKRLARFSAAVALFLAPLLGFAQVGSPVAGATAQSSVVLCKSYVAVTAPADTSEDTLATCNIPPLGINSQLRVWTLWTVTNNADVKTGRVRLGGIAGTQFTTLALASVATDQQLTIITNRAATNAQVGWQVASLSGLGSSGAAVVTGSLETNGGTTLVITGQKGTAGDTFTLEGYVVEHLTN